MIPAEITYAWFNYFPEVQPIRQRPVVGTILSWLKQRLSFASEYSTTSTLSVIIPPFQFSNVCARKILFHKDFIYITAKPNLFLPKKKKICVLREKLIQKTIIILFI